MRALTRTQKAALTKRTSRSRQTKQADLKHHRLRCVICRHPSRDQIEQAFLQWRSAKVIMAVFDLPAESTIYHHAHAFALFDRRDVSLRYAIGYIVEESDRVPVTAQDVIRAVFAFAHLNDRGLWMHPAKQSEIVVSGQPSPRTHPPENDPRPPEVPSIASQSNAQNHANH
jgi:hypothetical protein